MDERSVLVAVETASEGEAEALRAAAIRCAKSVYLPDGRRCNAHAQFGHAEHVHRLYYLDDQGPSGGPVYLVLPGSFGGHAETEGVCERGAGLPAPWAMPVSCNFSTLVTYGYGPREQDELRWLAYHKGEDVFQGGCRHRGRRFHLRLCPTGQAWLWTPANPNKPH